MSKAISSWMRLSFLALAGGLAAVLLWAVLIGGSVEPANVGKDGIVVTPNAEVAIFGGELVSPVK